MNWTNEQEQVIRSRGRNLLVSAAAGSGKTAVLVERIIQMITEGPHPIDIDQLLVMTFTNAAAAEMRERIALAIEEKLKEQPGQEHLQRQATLVHYAQITTIDSFCLNLIRDHFHLLDIDPSFRIGDEGELLLLRQDVMEALLETYYEQGNPSFEQFVDTYASGKADGGIEDYILQVYTFAQSNPWPALWLEACRMELVQMESGHMMDTQWMKFLLTDVKQQMQELREQMQRAISVCMEEGGPSVYVKTLRDDADLLDSLEQAKDYETLNRRLKEVSFGRLSAARGEIDAEKKNYVTSCRDRVKKAIGNLRENYAFEDMEEAVADLTGTKEVVLILLQLAEEFMIRYQAEKREKNMVDFNDLEHYALDVLVKPGEGTLQYSETADELSKRYAEILVDEYQDSNAVQETLIKSLSGERFGRPNVFMVGDVKQSIYKFRLARPELFMEKYETYTKEESPHQKIELHQNFRSRASVLESINDVFYAVMSKNLGNICYTEEAALHPGALFEATDREVGTKTELLLINTGKEASKQADEELAEYTSREMEAKVIANKIRELTHPTDGLSIWDKEKKEYRIAEYGDIVILLRSISGWTDSFLNVLTGEGIPAYAETGTGYFNTIEVETILSMLAVIDNPMQDIPLAAVFRSPIVGVTDEELAVLMTAYKKSTEKGQDRGLYGAFRFYLKGERPGDALWQKLVDFDKFQQEMCMEATYLPIHEVLYRVFVKTGYYDYVAAMPAGEVRRANLDMLVEKASAYEKTSYKGLFHFIRYIENLKKYDTDFGEASVAGQQEHTVRLMSIHKSKGLEFPVVILAGMGKLFNRQDVRGKLLIDSDLGIGTDYFDLERRLKTSTLKKNVLKRKIELDNLGEELRVLYVAMTRAKEKLILTAADRYLDKKLERWAQIPWDETRIPYTILSTAGSCLDWLLMSLSKPTGRITVEEIAVEKLVGEEVVRQIGKRSSKEELLAQHLKGVYDPIFLKDLQETLEFQYPYEADVNLHTKMSVSELKYRSQEALEPDNPYQPMIPKFLKEGTEFLHSGGAGRGTAYHRILELWDLAGAKSREDCAVVLEKFVMEKKLTQESRDQIDPQVLWQFVQSPLGQRMKNAQAEHRCHKEQQFVIGIPAVKMNLGESEELVLVQGIIDAYLEEADHLILIDYKTDRIHPGQEILLMNRYRTQLDYYQMALEQITGKKVTERILYSLALQKEIK